MEIKEEEGEIEIEDFSHYDDKYWLIESTDLNKITGGKGTFDIKISHIKLEAEDFELFVNECKFWINKLGLMDWNIDFSQHNNSHDQRCFAYWNCAGRVAAICLASTWDYSGHQDKQSVKEKIKRFALHEAMHLLMADVYCMIKNKYDKDTAEKEVHLIIWRMVNVLRGGLNDNIGACEGEVQATV